MSRIMLCSINDSANNNNNNNNNNESQELVNSWNHNKSGLYQCRAPIASLDCMEELQSPLLEGGPLSPPPNKEGGMATPSPLPSRGTPPTPGLRYRNLGKSGLRVSNIGLGTWVTFGGQLTEAESEEVIAAAYESGVNLFDLSEASSGPRAELELGRILKRRGWRRASYVIATKIFWSAKSEERGLSRKHIIESVRASLERLQLDYIDLVLIYKVDQMCPMEEVVRAMHHVITHGWTMYWGTARWTPVEIMEAYTNCRTFNCVTPICEQCEYHMFCRDKSELYMTELYNKIGVGMMTWSPLSMGLISSKMEDGVPLIARPSFKKKYASMSWTEDETQQGGNKESTWGRDRDGSERERERDHGKRSPAKLRELALLAEKLGCSLAQLAIAWSLKLDAVQCLLLGAASVDQLHEHMQSLQIVPRLTPSLAAEVEKLLDNKPVRPPMLSTLAQR